jgi:hypothetical protein
MKWHDKDGMICISNMLFVILSVSLLFSSFPFPDSSFERWYDMIWYLFLILDSRWDGMI